MSATMNATSETFSRSGPKAYQPILLGGLIAGTLDMTAACISAWLRAGVTPARVMRFIASGLLGPSALSGGAKVAALGLVLHYVIATGATAVFYFASRKLKFLIEHPVVWGILYGIPVYVFMNFIVLPLSAVPRRGGQPLSSHIIGLLILMFCIGLPISLIVRRFSK
jgi:hypothetical protein